MKVDGLNHIFHIYIYIYISIYSSNDRKKSLFSKKVEGLNLVKTYVVKCAYLVKTYVLKCAYKRLLLVNKIF